MFVHIIRRDPGEHLCSIGLDYSTEEKVEVAQMAARALEQSGLKAQGYTWCQVQLQSADNSTDLVTMDFDDPVDNGAIYKVLVRQKQQKSKESENSLAGLADSQISMGYEVLDLSETPIESPVQQKFESGPSNLLLAKQIPTQSMVIPNQSIVGHPNFAFGHASMTQQTFLLPFDLNAITPLQRKALGNNADVGNLYNVKTDTIIGNRQFSADSHLCNLGAFRMERKAKATCQTAESIDMDSRFEQLDIDVQQKISILALMSEVSGYGQFVQPEDILANNFGTTADEREICGFTIVQLLETKKISLNLRNTKVAAYLLDQANTTGFGNATHLLYSCTYGFAFCCVVTYDAEQGAKLNLDRIKQIIQKYLKIDYKTAADWNYVKSIENHFKIQLFADQQILSTLFGNEEQQKSLTLTQLVEGIKTKKLRSLLTNDFFGHPLSYELLPLDQLVQPELLDAENKVTRADPTLLANNLNQMEKAMAALAHTIQEYKQVGKRFAWFMSFEYCFGENVMNEMVELSNQLHEKLLDFESNCRQLIKAFRANHSRHEECVAAKECAVSSFNEFWRLSAELTEAMNMQDPKLTAGMNLKKIGVPFVGYQNTTLEKELENAGNYCYVLFTGQQDQEDPLAQEKIQLFRKLNEDGQKCVFVDTDLAEKPNDIPDGMRIVKYKNGKPQFDDYLKEHWRKLNTCIIRLLNSKQFAQTSSPSGDLIDMKIPCSNHLQFTSKNPCPDDDYHWECDECGQLVQYDGGMKLDETPVETDPSSLGYFYCACGRAPAFHFGFRCKNAQFHDEKFTEYTFSALSTLLKPFCKQEDSVNVLLLSETGCGKSTWINSLANYLTFESLEDAEKDGPAHVIPAMFHLQGKKITIGNVDETRRPGQSDTQQTTCHVFKYKGQKLKIFDTPGVCDTAGIGKDELNFKNIMWTIGNYNHLNGIIILMKPNSPRLTIAFKYCINELLKHLHKDAAKNIVFCFTQSSATNFTEGDTTPVLQELLEEIEQEHGVAIKLNEQTTYYVDNAAFRYLCMRKNNIQTPERVKNNALDSWEVTVPVIRQMLSYIQTLPPHDVAETVSLNEARRIIVTLAQPLARITQIIQVNINLAKTQQEKIGKLDADTADREKDLLTHQQRYVERNRLPHPRTICTEPKCTTVAIDEFGQSTTVYSTHCHSHCYLENVREESRADPGLMQCSAMHSDGYGRISCQICACTWDQHMHIYYELIDKTRTVENPVVKEMIKNNYDAKQIIECAMAQAEIRVQKNKQEQDRINEIAARFGTYLKQNGILSHNKYIEDYMEMHILNAHEEAQQANDEQAKCNARAKIKSLENALKCYLEQRQIIERYLDTGKETIQPSDIKKYLHELFNLELNGALIADLFDAEEESLKNRATCAENPFVQPHKPRPSRNSNYVSAQYANVNPQFGHNHSSYGYHQSSGSGSSIFSTNQQSSGYGFHGGANANHSRPPSSSSNFGGSYGNGNPTNYSRQQPAGHSAPKSGGGGFFGWLPWSKK